MKNLNSFIEEKLKIGKTSFMLEKLKINSKTNVQSNILDEILEFWGLDDEDKDINNAINQWIKDNNVNNVEFISDTKTLRDASDFLSDEILELYNCSSEEIEEANNELENAKNIYHHSSRGENIDIMATDKMIAILGWYGILYCVKK